jgi:ABC-type ATPase with predicted acetyltransferase domain
LKDEPLIVFDEFTSVVDREVAKIGSHAIQKAIRRTDKKFIAVGCHFDVEDWLLPDWIFNTNDMTYRVTAKKKDQTLNSEYLKQKESPNIGKCLVNIII